MDWPFKNQKKKVAIRIDKTYDTVEYTPSYRIGTEEEINEIINHAKTNPLLYRESIRKQDQLTYLPDIEITEINEVYPADEKIYIIARIHYIYTTKIPQQEVKILPGLTKAISLVALAFILITILSILVVKHQHEQNMINNTCYMYLKNGIPSTIEIDNTTYHINQNGSIDDIDAVFMNNYHKQILQYEECIKVNINGDKYIK